MMNKLAAALLVAVSACAAQSDDTLQISGQLTDSSQVTHVIATNVDTGERVVVDMKSDGEPDGRFRVMLPSGDGAWIVTFADASKTGEAMRVATLQSGGIDAFSAPEGGVLELGKVRFDGHLAHGTMTWESLAKVLGTTVDGVRARALVDDLALRYSNPDVDGNGKLDALEGHSFVLDFAGTYELSPAGQPTRYLGTAIEAGVPSDMGMHVATGTVQFQAPFYGTALGDNTPMIEAGVRIGQPHIKFGQLDGTSLVGVVASPERDVPTGSYAFGFDNGALTFSDVGVPAAAKLADPSTMAGLRLTPTVAGCTSDCAIDALDIAWPGEARDAKVDLVVSLDGRKINLSANLTGGESSIPWQSLSVDGTGITRSELAYITSSRVCYAAVTYTSAFGIKMTGHMTNPACF
jgi:hypothetical protein